MTSSNFRGPAIILLSGLPGSGKTTFARALAAALPARHLESDAVRAELFASPAYAPEESAAVFAAIEARAGEALTAGEHAVIDATNLSRADRERFLALARRLGLPLVAVRLIAPRSTVAERLSRPRDGASQANMRVYDEMRDRPEPFTIPCVQVDTRFETGPSIALVQRLAARRAA